jgi:hypothetical protein
VTDDRIYIEGKVHEAGATGNGTEQKCTRCGATLAAPDPAGGAADPFPPGTLVLEEDEEVGPGRVSTTWAPVDPQEAERYRRCDDVR